MNAVNPAPARFSRKALTATSPTRLAGGFYRTAQGAGNDALGGVPLVSAEAALTAAVRLGYRVAAAQVDRSADWARRLRTAGDQAVGPNSDLHAVDSIERLLFKSMLSGLEWLEGVTAEQGSPLKRLAATEYQWVGSLLGIDGKPPRPSGHTPTSAPTQHAAAAPEPPVSPPSAVPWRLRIKHKGVPRAVFVSGWDCAPITSQGDGIGLRFVARSRPAMEIPGSLTTPLDGNPAVLTLTIRKGAPSDTWSAAICDEGEQVGTIEIRF